MKRKIVYIICEQVALFRGIKSTTVDARGSKTENTHFSALKTLINIIGMFFATEYIEYLSA